MVNALGATKAKQAEIFKLYKTLSTEKVKAEYKCEILVAAFEPKKAKSTKKATKKAVAKTTKKSDSKAEDKTKKTSKKTTAKVASKKSIKTTEKSAK